jgi:hypothetical protein
MCYGIAVACGDYATVKVTKSGSDKSAIYFRLGSPLGADTSQTNFYSEFRAFKEYDLHIILIDSVRYKIPDAVILGGSVHVRQQASQINPLAVS